MNTKTLAKEILSFFTGIIVGFFLIHNPPHILDGKTVMLGDFHVHHWMWGTAATFVFTFFIYLERKKMFFAKGAGILMLWFLLGMSVGITAEGLIYQDHHSFEFFHNHNQ